MLESGGRVIQETRGWDEAAGVTHSMRSKEQAHDYRYFPEPDLVPLEIDRALIERLRAAMPPVPFARFERYTEQFGISVKQTTQLVDNPSLAAYFDRVVAGSAPDPRRRTSCSAIFRAWRTKPARRSPRAR